MKCRSQTMAGRVPVTTGVVVGDLFDVSSVRFSGRFGYSIGKVQV